MGKYLGFVVRDVHTVDGDEKVYINFYPFYQIEENGLSLLNDDDREAVLGVSARGNIRQFIALRDGEFLLKAKCKNHPHFYVIDLGEDNRLLSEENDGDKYVAHTYESFKQGKIVSADEEGYYPVLSKNEFPDQITNQVVKSNHSYRVCWIQKGLPITNGFVMSGKNKKERIIGPMYEKANKYGVCYQWHQPEESIVNLDLTENRRFSFINFSFVRLDINDGLPYDALSENEILETVYTYYKREKRMDFTDIWPVDQVGKDVIDYRVRKLIKYLFNTNVAEVNTEVEDRDVDLYGHFLDDLKGARSGEERESKEDNSQIDELSKLDSVYEYHKSLVSAELFENNPEKMIDYIVEQVQIERPDKYDRNMIVNILICIMQGFITVFAGDPGCGKTSYCDILGKVLGLTNKMAPKDAESVLDYYRYLNISVERGWMSKKDLIGYYNPISHSIDKNNEFLYNGIKLLNKEIKELKDGNIEEFPFPFFVLLDEANLSSMEYYWSEFMNVCDGIKEDSYINLGDNEKLYIPENLRFLATINTDNTTFPLSPRLINRSWVITLPKADIPENPRYIDESKCKSISWSLLKKTFGCMDSVYSKSEEGTESFEYRQVYRQMREVFATIRVDLSPRVEKSIIKYWRAAKKYFVADGDQSASLVAFDYAVMQKLLPQINGFGVDYGMKLMSNEMISEYYMDDAEDILANREAKNVKGLLDILNENNLLKSAEMLKKIIERGKLDMDYYHFF